MYPTGHSVPVSTTPRTSFVIIHVLDSPREMLPLQSGDICPIISLPGGGVGVVSVTEYSPSPKITVVPATEPGNELGEGSLPCTWIVKADGDGDGHVEEGGKVVGGVEGGLVVGGGVGDGGSGGKMIC